MRNFFEHQDAARSRSLRLVFLFSFAIAGIVCAIYALTALLDPVIRETTGASVDWSNIRWWNPPLFTTVAVVVTGTILLTSWVKIRQLAGGGAVVAQSLGGRLVDPGTTEPRERRLLNVVEEMSIASGVPVPLVYVLDGSDGINAFAAGYDVGDAAVAVTRGALHILSRDELQGVIAHEFSHVLNGDMRLNIRLIGLLHGIMVIGATGATIVRMAFRGMARAGSNRNSAGGAILLTLVGGFIWLVGSLGLFFGRAIQRAVSRQREYLADASAVQFTRNPRGLVGALMKIGGYSEGTSVVAPGLAEVSHLFFGDVVGRVFGGMMSTHPEISTRIERLDPAFHGAFPPVKKPDSMIATRAPSHASALAPEAPGSMAMSMEHPGQLVTDVTGAAPASIAPPQADSPVPDLSSGGALRADPASVIARTGTVSPETLAYGAALIQAIPGPLRDAARSPLGAVALVYGMLLDHRSADHRAEQLEALERTTHADVLEEVGRVESLVAGIDPALRLPLVELAAPSLRRLSPDQYAAFRSEIDALVTSDERTTLFEFAIRRSIVHWLDETFGGAGRPAPQYYALRPLARPIQTLLSALALVGANDSFAAMSAFKSGIGRLRLLAKEGLELLSPDRCGFEQLGDVLTTLSGMSPPMKGLVVDAAAHVVLHDRQVTVEEAELLRVICVSLGVPLPPFLPSTAADDGAAGEIAPGGPGSASSV